MKFAVTIVSPPRYHHSECFREVAETIDYGFRALGHDSIITDDGNIPGRQHIVLGANLLADYACDLADNAILYNLEQIGDNDRWAGKALIDLYQRHTIWDYSDDNIAAFARHGVLVAHRLPVSYAPILTRVPRAAEQDIDILFVGSTNDRREVVTDEMRRIGLNVVSLWDYYGARRDAFIGRAKLMLNLHYYPAKIFEIVRISYYLANGCAVLSERSGNPVEDTAFEEGVAFCDYEQLVEQAVELCRNPGQRARLGAQGQQLFASRRIEDALPSAIASLRH